MPEQCAHHETLQRVRCNEGVATGRAQDDARAALFLGHPHRAFELTFHGAIDGGGTQPADPGARLGEPLEIAEDQIPVFWACGVTPQSAILNAQPAFCITHAPGCMLVTDLLNHQLASF